MDKNNTLYEIFSFSLLALGAFILLSLCSYCPQDYAQDVYPAHNYLHNLGGQPGSSLSRTLFTWIGQSSSFLMGALLVLWGGWVFLCGPKNLSLGGVALLVFTVAMMEAEFGWALHTTLPPGGKYGIFLAAFLKAHVPFWMRYCAYLSLAGFSWYWILQRKQEGELWEEEETPPKEETPSPTPARPSLELANPAMASQSLKKTLFSPSEGGPFSLPLGFSTQGAHEAREMTFKNSPGMLIAGENSSELVQLMDSLMASLLHRYTPEELRIALLDSRGNLKKYQGVPHLLCPVLKDWTRLEELWSWMEKEITLRNLEERTRPFVLVVVEELGELMLSVPREMERFFQKLSKSTSLGINSLLFTSRPSLDVVTPTVQTLCQHRMALQVSSRIESDILIGQAGAEALPERGEGLYLGGLLEEPEKLHLLQVGEREIQKTVHYLTSRSAPQYELLQGKKVG